MNGRIGIIHATRLSIEPLESAFGRHWPKAPRTHLLDDSLLQDRRAAGTLTPALYARIAALANHSYDSGARFILFSCSAFGPAIEAARSQMDVPVLKPYEAMVEAALDKGARIVALSTFGPTLSELKDEVEAVAAKRSITVQLRTHAAEAALPALEAGRADEHDQIVAEAAAQFEDCDALMLAQYSTASAARLIRAIPGRTVLTSPDTAVELLKKRLG